MIQRLNIKGQVMPWQDFKFFYTDHIEVPLPLGHRFPMEKYRMLHESVLREDIMQESQLFPAPLASDADLLLAHDKQYVFGLKNHSLPEKELRTIGLTWSPKLLERSYAAVGGFIKVTEAAMKDGYSSLLAGGTHHAHADRGEGYCVFNDFAVAALKLIQEGKRVLIIDLDVHQGNGNSSILGSRNDVFILSLHGEKNYPFRKVPSHLDVALPEKTKDTEYLHALQKALENIPEGFDILLYQAGVDNLKEDTLGTFEMSFEGLMRRDEMIFGYAKNCGLPVAMAIGGGYAKPIELTVRAHLNTFLMARKILG